MILGTLESTLDSARKSDSLPSARVSVTSTVSKCGEESVRWVREIKIGISGLKESGSGCAMGARSGIGVANGV